MSFPMRHQKPWKENEADRPEWIEVIQTMVFGRPINDQNHRCPWFGLIDVWTPININKQFYSKWIQCKPQRPYSKRVRHATFTSQVDVVLLQIALGFCALLMRYLSRTATHWVWHTKWWTIQKIAVYGIDARKWWKIHGNSFSCWLFIPILSCFKISKSG